MKPVWFVFAAALVAFLIWRRHRLGKTLLVAGAAVAAGAVVYGFGVVRLPSLEQLLLDIGDRLGKWTYLLVGGLAFLETGAFIGLVAPGETALLVGGLVAGQGQIELGAMIAIAWAAAVAGDLTSFALGRRLGRPFLERNGPRVKITEDRLRQVEGFFARHGGKAILIGRFVGLVRAVAPFLAGSSGVPLRRFVPYDVVGAGLWATTFVVLGYVFWQSFSELVNLAKKGAFALGAVIVLIVAVVGAIRWLRVRENRVRARRWLDRQAQRPALRPVVAVLAPVARHLRRPARFVWHRLTPGQLGLELTTLLAIAGVGAFVFVGELVVVARGDTPWGDPRAAQVADDLFVEPVVDAAKVVTALGALPVAIGVIVLCAFVLVHHQRAGYAMTLGTGMALTFVAVHVVKGAVDRPRPSDPLVDVTGAAYPSAHAAYAVTWVAAAVALGRVLPSLTSRLSLVTAAVILAAVVGLSRVYLRVHFLSDVIGGWGIAAAIYAVCGIMALVVGYVRNNEALRA